ncbi:MAG: acyl-CoA dehydrogenase family protein [Chloroflexota bacterium]
MIRAAAGRTESERRVPQEVIDALVQAGMFHMVLPASVGGGGHSPLVASRAVEEIAYADASTGWVVMLAQQSAMFAIFMSDEDNTAIFGNGGIIAGTARPIGRAVWTESLAPGYLVSGRWPFASGSSHATYFMGECVVYDGDEPRKDGEGNTVTRAVFVPRDAVTVFETWDTTGLRGTASNDFEVTNAFVPASRGFQMLVSPPIQPWAKPGVEPLAFMNHGSHALGVARAAIDAAAELMRTKKGWGDAPLSLLPRMQTAIAEATALVESARVYLYASAEALEAELDAGRMGEPTQRSRVRLAASHAMSASVQAVDLVHRALATSSIQMSSALERPFRDIHTAAAHVMIGPMTYEAAGRVELGLSPDFPFF